MTSACLAFFIKLVSLIICLFVTANLLSAKYPDKTEVADGETVFQGELMERRTYLYIYWTLISNLSQKQKGVFL